MSNCYTILAQELGIDATTARQKVKEIQRRQNELSQQKRADALGKSIEEIAAQDIRNAKIKAFRKLQTAQLIRRIGLNRSDTLDGKTRIFKRYMRLTAADKVASVEFILSKFVNELNKNDLWDVFQSPDYSDLVAQAIQDPESVSNLKVKQIGHIVRDLFEYQRNMLNIHGGFVGKLDDYIVSQTHNINKLISPTGTTLGDIKMRAQLVARHGWSQASQMIRETAYNRWKNEIWDQLDHDRTFGDRDDPEKEEFLRAAYDHLTHYVTPGAGEEEEIMGFPQRLPLGSKVGAQRKLHFKNGMWVKYNETYGTGTTQSSIIHTLTRNAENLALMRNFGYDPDRLFTHIHRNVLKKPDADMLRYEWDGITGAANVPVDALLAKIGSSLRAIASLTKLGGVVVTAIPDLNNRMVMMKSNGVGFLDGYANYAKDSLSVMSNEREAKELALMLGIVGKTHMGNITTRFWTPESPLQALSKAQDVWFKFNLLHQWDYLNQTTAAMGLSKNLASLKDLEFQNLPESLQETFKNYEIGKDEWNLIRNKSLKPYKNENYLTPDSADHITDEEAQSYLTNKNLDYGKNSEDIVRDQIKSKLQAYLHDQSSLVSLTPDSYDRALVLRGTRPGTLLGEFLRFFGQFKYYNIAFTRKIVKSAFVGPAAGLATGAQFIVSGMILGYISYAMKSFLQTGQIPDPFTANRDQLKNIISQSFITGGSGGIYTSWMANWKDQLTSQLGETLTPAGAEAPSDLLNIAQQAIREFALNDPKAHPAKAASRFLKNDVPFVNAFYTKYVFDHMILNDMMNRVDPGYMTRKQRKFQQDYNGKYLF